MQNMIVSCKETFDANSFIMIEYGRQIMPDFHLFCFLFQKVYILTKLLLIKNLLHKETTCMSELNKHIGKQIRMYRKVQGLTLQQLADLIHKSRASVSKYETGEITLDV